MASGATNQDGFSSGSSVTWNGLGYTESVYPGRWWAILSVMGQNAAVPGGDGSVADSIARFQAAGQLVNARLLEPSIAAVGNGWYAIPLDAAIIQDIAQYPQDPNKPQAQNKGIVFCAYTSAYDSAAPLSNGWANDTFYSRNESNGASAAYITCICLAA